MARPINAPAPVPMIAPSIFEPPGAIIVLSAAGNAADNRSGGAIVPLAVVAVVGAAVDAIAPVHTPRTRGAIVLAVIARAASDVPMISGQNGRFASCSDESRGRKRTASKNCSASPFLSAS